MKTATIYTSEICSQKKFKPSFFLNDGKRNMVELKRNNHIVGVLGDIVEKVFRPGIFKRIFVEDNKYGKEYFTASNMMTTNPLMFAKYLSYKRTANLDYMSVHTHYILVSCAGTVGNIRLIDTRLDSSIASQDIIRVVPKDDNWGFVYAFLCTSTIFSYIQSLIYGSVVPRIEPNTISNIPLPRFTKEIQVQTNELMEDSARLREEAANILSEAERLLKKGSGLHELVLEDYDYYGPRNAERKVSCFIVKRKDINTTTINAFNLSERIRKTKDSIVCKTEPLREVLLGGDTFSTGSFPRVEVKEGFGVMLINQKDIFDNIVKGKYISKRGVKTDNLVEYGEILIAGVGTLGESETFCRAIFANEDLVGQLVSGEFIRMKTNDEIPSGYLYAWLASDYGFRFLRNIQAGTKLCRPIPKLVLELPVPILNKETMLKIDSIVKEAHTKRYEANNCERKAIRMVEQEIEKWNKH